MIKVQNNTATRDPLPLFLKGLAQETLYDLSWTDPALGVQDFAWWPEVNESLSLPDYFYRYGAETLTIDSERKVVVVTQAIEPLTDSEPVIPAPDYGTRISRLAFKLRMTADERKSIRVAAESNADLYDFMDLLSDSTYIDLSRAETIAGVGQLEAAGLIATGRGDEVLNTPVTKEEQWNVERALS